MKSGKFNLLFIVSSYVNSLELYVTHIVFYQNQFDLRIIPIVEKGIVNNILVIPVDFSLSRDQIVEQFSQYYMKCRTLKELSKVILQESLQL